MKTKKRIYVIGGIVLGLILVLSISVFAYIESLTGLVEQGEDEPFPTTATLEATTTVATETVLPTTETTIEVTTTTEVDEAALIDVRSDSKVYNILLVGSDRRDTESSGRSDAMIILSINKRTHKIHLASLTRGLYVKIPDHGKYMLNAAYSYGGSKLMRETIELNFRVHIDDYIRIDFSGFETAINAVGGVDIDLTEKEVAELNLEFGTVLSAGPNHLDGALALAYSRIRHIDSDYARTGRQRKVIECLIHQMGQLDALQLDGMLRQVLPLIKTNLGADKLIGLAMDGLQYKDYPISQLMLPVKGTYKTIIVNGMQVEKFDFSDNIEAMHHFLFD